MTKPQYDEMSLPELRAYVLSHSEDEQAFHTYIDRRRALNPNRVSYPPPTTPEGQAIME